ncbi:Stk1 family PASTA domain-containing Ser/Thr kinase [Sesbania bispinosa]|nr:Stk1 family PASTA domain-containing Ser/Thr kinase [Sesbania bispinosa]
MIGKDASPSEMYNMATRSKVVEEVKGKSPTQSKHNMSVAQEHVTQSPVEVEAQVLVTKSTLESVVQVHLTKSPAQTVAQEQPQSTRNVREKLRANFVGKENGPSTRDEEVRERGKK